MSEDDTGRDRDEHGSADGVPPDVCATLESLLSTVEQVEGDEDPETAQSALDTAGTVVRNEVADPDERERLAHGCRRARAALDAGDPALAAGYARALRARLA